MPVRRSTLNLGQRSTSTRSRRAFLQTLASGGLVTAASQVSWAQTGNKTQPVATHTAPRSGLLVQPTDLAALNTRAKLALELTGQLHVRDEVETADKQFAGTGIEVKAVSTLDYYEKVAFGEAAQTRLAQPLAAARRYLQADIENWVAGTTTRRELRPDCRETRLLPYKGLWQQYCETLPLDSRETQLLQSPINSAAVDKLLPTEPAKPDAPWSIRSDDAKLIFNLDAVHGSTLTARISKVEKGVATVELSGLLEATANSVPTRLEIKGNFQAKLGSRTALVTWLGIIVQEKREVCQAEPGFNLTARIRMIREETPEQLAISEGALRQLASDPDEGRWLVRLYSQAGHYSMLADRRWHIHRDSAEEAILRMVENNTVIAQCAVSRLSALEPGQQLTMDGLQADIKKSLGDTFREFLEAGEKVTPTQLRLLRTVVAGEVDEVPIHWIYSHLSDDSGRRLALVFTMGGNVTDRFGAADEQMALSFDWLPDRSATEANESPATPAKPSKLTAEAPAARRAR